MGRSLWPTYRAAHLNACEITPPECVAVVLKACAGDTVAAPGQSTDA